MEIVDNAVLLMVPGAMEAGLTSFLFWGALAFSLVVAFVVSVPVNRWLIGRARATRWCTSTTTEQELRVSGRVYVRHMTRQRDAVLLDRIVSRRALMSQLEAEESEDMLALADFRRGDAVARGFREPESAASFAADEVAIELHVSSRSVQNRMHAARTVRDELPAVWAAHCLGRIDSWRVSLIAATAFRLQLPESASALDAKVVPYAVSHTPAQLKAWLRRFVARTEPEQVIERRKHDLEQRSVYFDHDDDGVSWLHAMMSGEDAVLLDRDLTLAAKASAQSDDRTLPQARADVLVDRLLGREGGETGRGRFYIGITIPVTSMLGLDVDPGSAVDGSFALPPELVREIASHPGTLFSRIITDPLGGVLDVTELGRFPTEALGRALELIDGVCVFPTCSRPAADADKDHQIPHPNGPTSGTNLWSLCRRHHRMKTLGVVDTDVGSHGRHRWTMPSGRVIESRGHLVRPFAAFSALEATLAGLSDAA